MALLRFVFLLKCLYYGFLKMMFHAVCNSSTWMKTSCKDWNLKVHKVIVSQKKASTLNHWKESFLKPIPVWRQHETLAYFPPLVGLNENANSFFATRCRFWGGKNSSFPGNAVHKVALLNTALSGEMRMRPIDQSEQIRVTQRSGLEKWIVERIVWESLCK